ncbi:hypothetical protein XELAEV_18024544mg [Xenopus laevis]|uniref:Uncharacterized protein n=1 Tax=Xenopus laevis TaxID=8355 RepID=A0A974D0N4_XENLA|nr:hypothetical protein XELAEV_18024544mg [Xenopus laevis]
MAFMIVSETNTLAQLCCFIGAEPIFSLAKSLALWNPKEIECFIFSAGTAPSFPLRVSSAIDSASSLQSSSSSAGPPAFPAAVLILQHNPSAALSDSWAPSAETSPDFWILLHVC